jgi:hypothetical protein
MPPMARLPKLLWLTGLSVVLASAVLPGCGDDDGGEPGEETGGKGGSTGGKGGGTTGGKGGAAPTGGKGGATTGGSTQGGEGGAPVGTGGAPVGTGGAVEPPGGAGAGGVPVVGGAGAGGVPDIGGAGGAAGAPVEGSGGTDSGEGGSGGEGGEVALLECDDNGNFPAGDGKDCAEYCDDFADNCGAYGPTEDTYANEAACLSECAGLAVDALCCRAAHANDAAAAIEGPDGHCEAAAGDDGCP